MTIRKTKSKTNDNQEQGLRSNFEKTALYHKEVAQEIINMIEAGTVPWMQPWTGGLNLPHNGGSGRRYRGMNSLMLSYYSQKKGYTDPRWYTFNQIKNAGAHLRKDEHGVKVEYWKFEKEIKLSDGTKAIEKLAPPRAFRATVFNAEQAEGLPPYVKPELTWQPVERAEDVMKSVGVPIYHDQQDRNFYRPSSDEIHLTPKESFKTEDAYYNVALHELSHSTGHESRLDRKIINGFGSEDYAREELRAEIASYMLCSELGISTEANRGRNAAYVESWVQVLKEDPNEIFRAARDAEAIAEFLFDKEKEYKKTLETGKETTGVKVVSDKCKTTEKSKVVSKALKPKRRLLKRSEREQRHSRATDMDMSL